MKNISQQQFVTGKINHLKGKSIVFTSDIITTLKSLKSEKWYGVDGLATEHYIFPNSIIDVFLFLLFDKNFYRPIALVTAAAKLFKICILGNLKCTR